MSPASPNLPVADATFPSPEHRGAFLENHQVPRRPLLIRGGLRHWPAIAAWTRDRLVAESGDYVCHVVHDSRPAQATERTTLREYFARNSPALSTLTLEPYVPGRLPRFITGLDAPNALFDSVDLRRFFFFHAHAGSGTLPHTHGDAFNFLQSGSKDWVLFDAHPVLAPRGRVLEQHYHRTYGPGAQARDWFTREVPSLGSRIALLQFRQEAGDIVFIPAGYCHAVLNVTEVMGVALECRPR